MEAIVVLTSGTDFSQVEEYLRYVSALRQNRIAKKRSPEDKLLSLTAGLLLSQELSRRTGIPQNKLCYRHGSFGKPYLIGSDVQFSLSHTKGAVCAAFSDKDEVGADIESRTRRIRPELYSRVLNENERQSVHSGEDFVRLWVQKEAFLKRLGTGIATDLRGADTSLMKDTVVRECGGFLVGLSGQGADNAVLQVIFMEELLSGFKK